MRGYKKMEISAGQPQTISLLITDCQAGFRLDRAIMCLIAHYSRNYIQNLIKEGLVTINNCAVNKPSIPVKSNDQIIISIPPKRVIEPEVIKERVTEADLAIEVIAEHEDFLIIYKPDNLLVHAPSARSNAITLVDWLTIHYPELIGVGYSDRPGIVHRLDKDTSGLMIIPRTAHAHAVFSKMFQDRAIQKMYYALVQGHPPATGIIDRPIGRSPAGNKMMVYPGLNLQALHNRRPHARHAITEYKVVQYFKGYALIEARLVTGRTHQIRVHFASSGYPLLGDPLYGKKSKFIKRQALHAYSLSFVFDGKNYCFTKDLPADFQQAIDQLEPMQSNQ